MFGIKELRSEIKYEREQRYAIFDEICKLKGELEYQEKFNDALAGFLGVRVVDRGYFGTNVLTMEKTEQADSLRKQFEALCQHLGVKIEMVEASRHLEVKTVKVPSAKEA